MQITVLVENSKCSKNNKNLKAVHGLSLYIEHNNKKIIMDVGPDDTFLNNAKEMNIDISDVDYLILSHGHMDHGGGLKAFIDNNDKAKIFMHRSAVNKFYTKLLGFFPVYIGLNQRVIKEYKNRLTLIDSDTDLEEGIMLFSGFAGNFPGPTSNNSLYYKKGNKYIHDDFNHELILVVENRDSSVLFTACSHSGIINMIDSVKKRLSRDTISEVFGGFHLYNPVNRRSEKLDYIKKLSAELDKDNTVYYTGHCTGIENFKLLKSFLGDKINAINTGSIIII